MAGLQSLLDLLGGQQQPQQTPTGAPANPPPPANAPGLTGRATGFAAQQQDPSTRERLSELVATFGSAFEGGRGPNTQFLAGIPLQDTRRRKAAFDDLFSARTKLKAAIDKAQRTGELLDISDIEDLGIKRIATVKERGGDPTDTENELRLLRAEPLETLTAWDREIEIGAQEFGVKLPASFFAEKDELTAQMRNAAAVSGARPGTPEFQAALKKILKFDEGGTLKATKEEQNFKSSTGLDTNTPEGQQAFAEFLQPQSRVQNSENLAGGFTKFVTSDQKTVLVDPGGEIVPIGKERANAFKKIANEQLRGVRVTQEMKSNVKRADKAFDSIEAVRLSVSNIDEAIKAIDDGANTGFIENKFPSITASSQRLENVGRRMGLDVIGAVTFGALSQGELDLAMATALPADLQEEDLKQWLLGRRDAQIKLMNYYENAALHFSSGKGLSEFITNQKAQRQGVISGGTINTPAGGQVRLAN